MEAREPWIPDFSEGSRWHWEWWKGHEAFHYDVSEAAYEAKNIDDFYARLALRRNERLQELQKAWDHIAIKIICSPTILGDDLDGHLTHLCAFQRFTSNRSLDSMVLFFDSFLTPTTPAAPQLRSTPLSGSPPAEADRTESSMPDTAPGSPQANPLDSTPRARQQPTPPPPPPPPPQPPTPSPAPRRTTRRPPPPPTRPIRHAGIAKRRQHDHRFRQRASDAKEPSIGAQSPSSSRHKRPFRQGKGPGTKTRASRRLAGHPPELGGA
ncbi:hypothetical protein B0T19DRAFT_454347 [Cercophora scortea]|uniref:Uncharacterized protein n=1 Tax=Cercophora scortea TaxID=314031 RepID=A0AAE0MM87_9PEZI|nr:hypothetical protein B0T19DRAFT_454347 [Cercophora scortea]